MSDDAIRSRSEMKRIAMSAPYKAEEIWWKEVLRADRLKAKIERLKAALVSAPHGFACSVSEEEPCNCWKAEARKITDSGEG